MVYSALYLLQFIKIIFILQSFEILKWLQDALQD